MQGKGDFTSIKVGEQVLQYSLSLDSSMMGNVAHDHSVEYTDWHIVTNRGHKLPLTESEDEAGKMVPLEGVWARLLNRKLPDLSLVVKFNYASLRKRAGATDVMPFKSYLLLFDGLSAPTSDAAHCLDLIDTVFGPDIFVTMEQAKALFDCINQPTDMRFRELSAVRSHFLSKCYHKIVESSRNKELLDWCSLQVLVASILLYRVLHLAALPAP
jgi:hypothetical protein